MSIRACLIQARVEEIRGKDRQDGCARPDQPPIEAIVEKALPFGNGRGNSSIPGKIPALSIRVTDQLEMFDESHFLDVQWNLAECEPLLTEGDFPSEVDTGTEAEVDVSDAGRIEMRFVRQLRRQLTLLRAESGWTGARC